MRDRILLIKDGVARATHSRAIPAGSVVRVINPDNSWVFGLVFNIRKFTIDVVILGNEDNVTAGALLVKANSTFEVNVTGYPSGSVIDPLGNFLNADWLEYLSNNFALKSHFIRFQYVSEAIKGAVKKAAEAPAVSIIGRKTIDTPVLTGLKVLDSLIPIGRGQRELIIGDRQTGKTTVALDAIQNQTQSGYFGEVDSAKVMSIYVTIGQKINSLLLAVTAFVKFSFSNCLFVTAPAYFPAPLQFLSAYVGCSLGEWFRDLGYHSLVVFDDLSKHATAYRQMSLLLRRPPGREAYPGDVFYIHSRLLERAANVSLSLGKGSLTALPVIETLGGDVSAYIPTNVISITDGQIFLDADLFFKGVRPSINVGLSVSRVGSAAQHKVTKNLAGNLKLELAQFRENEAFLQFDADLDATTEAILRRGVRLVESLIQPPSKPLSEAEQYVSLFSAIKGLLDSVSVTDVVAAQQKLLTPAAGIFKGALQM